MCRRILPFVFAVGLLSASAGCGSKISQANYYRVHYGMTEDEVEDVLGPPHEVTMLPPGPRTQASGGQAVPPSTRTVERKQLTWSREGIVLRIVLTDGVVTARSADGIPAERPSTSPAV